MTMRLLLLALVVLGCGSPPAAGPGDERAPPRAVRADRALPDAGTGSASVSIPWRWDGAADLYPAVDLTVEHAGARFVVSLSKGARDRPRAVTLRGPGWTVEVARSTGSGGAALVVDDARVYVATYDRISAGCKLAAYATSNGTLAWAVDLDGIGPIGHSKYSNRVELRLVHGHPVVWGREGKRYIEERAAATGALVSHQLLAPEPLVRPIGESLYGELDLVLANRTVSTIAINDFLARGVLMQGADHAARGAAVAEAVRQLQGVAIAGGAYRLDLQLVDTGGDFELRAKRR
jgi:hypothetical protein